MNEHPILFSTPMVKANLDGRKTMTRRMTVLDKINENPNIYEYHGTLPDNQFIHVFARMWKGNHVETVHVNCLYGKSGDLLWVRETWCPLFGEFLHKQSNLPFMYKADVVEPYPGFEKSEMKKYGFKWKPSIHMPKTAARIWLQVEEVRVERLQDISEEDMISEGVVIPVSEFNTPLFVIGTSNSAFSFLPDGCLADGATPPTKKQILFAFWAELWCKINGRESWDANPWVWVVKYKMISTTGKPNS